MRVGVVPDLEDSPGTLAQSGFQRTARMAHLLKQHPSIQRPWISVKQQVMPRLSKPTSWTLIKSKARFHRRQPGSHRLLNQGQCA
jgi:hypothetical protein